MNSGIRRLYEDLRSISVVVVYPPGEDRDVLLEQIKRIGCRLTIVWPFPPTPPVGADVVMFQVSQELEGSSGWRATEVSSTLIALSDYESPTNLKLLLDTHDYCLPVVLVLGIVVGGGKRASLYDCWLVLGIIRCSSIAMCCG